MLGGDSISERERYPRGYGCDVLIPVPQEYHRVLSTT